MARKTIHRLSIGTAALAMLLGSGAAAAQRADTTVTVIVPVDVEQGASTGKAIAAMKEIAGFIHTQPGLVAEQMMVGDYAGAPKYLHVMRWRSLADWTALGDSRRFQQLLSKDLPFVKVRLAQAYRRLP